MFKTTFNPGPAQISKEVKRDIQKAMDTRIIELSHRSSEFTEMSKKAIEGIREYFGVPNDYKIFYSGSASELWAYILGNCVESKSYHFFNGNFSKQFYETAVTKKLDCSPNEAEWGELNDFKHARIDMDTELIGVCYNETSTGVMCSDEDIKYLSTTYPQAIIAVDLTSAAGTKKFNIADADIWYFSVQKGLGLLAGMGIFFVSPKAYQKAVELNKKGVNKEFIYNFERMWEMMEPPKYQTIHTPNVMDIFLVSEQITRWNENGGIEVKEQKARLKYQLMKEFLETSDKFSFFVKDENIRSYITMTVQADKENIQKAHQKCAENGIILGSGYGKINEITFRVANFDAVSVEEMKKLIEVLKGV